MLMLILMLMLMLLSNYAHAHTYVQLFICRAQLKEDFTQNEYFGDYRKQVTDMWYKRMCNLGCVVLCGLVSTMSDNRTCLCLCRREKGLQRHSAGILHHQQGSPKMNMGQF